MIRNTKGTDTEEKRHRGSLLYNPQLIEKRDALVAAGVPESKATCQVKGVLGNVLHNLQLHD